MCLFSEKDITMLSPKLQWLKDHDIVVGICDDKWPSYCAYSRKQDQAAWGDDEHDALCNLAIKLGIKLWNEKPWEV